MRILQVVPTYLPAWRYGGTVTSVHALSRALAQSGHEVHVFTTNVDGPGNSPVELFHPTLIDGVSVHYFPSESLRRIYWSPELGRELEGSVRTFDIVHLHSVFLWPTLRAAMECRKFRVPYVLSPRGMLVQHLIASKQRLLKRVWIELFERSTIRGAAAIHLTSALEKEEFDRFGFRPRRVAIIPNGVEQPPELQVERVANRILCLGRIAEKKRLDLVIDALPSLPSATLRIVGPDDEGLGSALAAQARQLGVSDRVVIEAAVSGEAKWRELASAHVLVLPSSSENFGNVVLEAMAIGTPVITTSEVGAAPLVREAEAGTVLSANDSLANAIGDLLADPRLARDMGRRGQEWVSQSGGWDDVAASTAALYAECIQAPLR